MYLIAMLEPHGRASDPNYVAVALTPRFLDKLNRIRASVEQMRKEVRYMHDRIPYVEIIWGYNIYGTSLELQLLDTKEPLFSIDRPYTFARDAPGDWGIRLHCTDVFLGMTSNRKLYFEHNPWRFRALSPSTDRTRSFAVPVEKIFEGPSAQN